MKVLITALLMVSSVAGAQEVREVQRGDERREQKIERPEPVRAQPPVQERKEEQPPRHAQPRPHPDQPPVVNRPPVVVVDPWTRRTGPTPWIAMQMEYSRRLRMQDRFRDTRPTRLEMMPIRGELTEKQQRQLLALRREYREKVRKILNNP